nr:serine/threonine-protein kinase EDR1 isoform X2 [Tanacetum cinerariifolium]
MDNIKTTYEHVDAYSCVRNVSVQIEEYHELENGSQKLRAFLLPLNDPASPFSYDSVSQSSSSDYEYVIATMDSNHTFQHEFPASSMDMMKNVSNANIMQMHSDIMTLNVQEASSGVTAQLTGLLGYSELVNQQDNIQDVNKPYIVWKEDMINWNEPLDLDDVSLGESHEESEDKNVGDISGIPVMVEDVTADLSRGIPLSTKAVQFLQEEPNAESVAQSDSATKDFWREAQLLSNLHHPNVVALYGVVPDGPGGTLSHVIEYMTNRSLRHVLIENNRALDCPF